MNEQDFDRLMSACERLYNRQNAMDDPYAFHKAVEKAALEMDKREEFCDWGRVSKYGDWVTGCGEKVYCSSKSDFIYCPFCGNKIKEVENE